MMAKQHSLAVNTLAPSVQYALHLIKILILKYEGIIDKISYERRRAYEAVDDGAYRRLHLISLRKAEFRSQVVIFVNDLLSLQARLMKYNHLLQYSVVIRDLTIDQ